MVFWVQVHSILFFFHLLWISDQWLWFKVCGDRVISLRSSCSIVADFNVQSLVALSMLDRCTINSLMTSPWRAAKWSGSCRRRWYSVILCGFSLFQQPCGLPWCSRNNIFRNRVGIWPTVLHKVYKQFSCPFSCLPQAMFFKERSERYLFGNNDDEPISTLA